MTNQDLQILGASPLRRQNSLPLPANQHAEILKQFGCDKTTEPDLGLYIDNLLVQWLTSPETKSLISDLLAGKTPQPQNSDKNNNNSKNIKTSKNSNNQKPKNNQNSLHPDDKPRHISSETENSEILDNSISPRNSTGIKLPAKASSTISPHPNSETLSPRKDCTLHLPKPVTRTSSNANRSSLSASFKLQTNSKPIVPRFYFPFGQKNAERDSKNSLDKVSSAFKKLPGGKIARLKDMD